MHFAKLITESRPTLATIDDHVLFEGGAGDRFSGGTPVPEEGNEVGLLRTKFRSRVSRLDNVRVNLQ
jgi:hypothetical protein